MFGNIFISEGFVLSMDRLVIEDLYHIETVGIPDYRMAVESGVVRDPFEIMERYLRNRSLEQMGEDNRRMWNFYGKWAPLITWGRK
jgi:hypothetical protein